MSGIRARPYNAGNFSCARFRTIRNPQLTKAGGISAGKNHLDHLLLLHELRCAMGCFSGSQMPLPMIPTSLLIFTSLPRANRPSRCCKWNHLRPIDAILQLDGRGPSNGMNCIRFGWRSMRMTLARLYTRASVALTEPRMDG